MSDNFPTNQQVHPPAAAPDRPPDILIVDDTPENLRLLSSMLTTQGYAVRKAISGPMALSALQALKPDLVLLDINMPGMNGYEVCRHLKASAHLREIPVVFLSASDNALDKVQAFQVGGSDYVTKPFQIEEVVARIENQLTIARQRQLLQDQKKRLEAEIQERKKIEIELARQQMRSETLILNIFPMAIAERLKNGEQTIAGYFDQVTVLFADLVGFTTLAAQISPTALVQLLNQIFSHFDWLVEQFNLEKIKTIGDAYMAVAGLPFAQDNHAQAAIEMAIAMQKELNLFNQECHQNLKIRIGISSGPVVAGVIGIKKFTYDLWGDTVNTASRMESHGIAGCIQVSESTYQYLRDRYHFEVRDRVVIKGKGEMTTYVLK